VSDEENMELNKEMEEEEIIDATWGLELDKTSSMDGFSIHYYHACWSIIKIDLRRMLSMSINKCNIRGCTNSSFLALIPKEINPSTFQPSPLITCLTKS
jgi:hypothetical protein